MLGLKLTILVVGVSLASVAGARGAHGEPSADRRLVAFAATRGGNMDIYVMRADGTGVRRLTRAAGRDDTPAWSPDGTQRVSLLT
jgi:Tol biopolymer transport system component